MKTHSIVIWNEVPISSIGTVVGGGTPPTWNNMYYDGKIPWITPKDLSGFHERYISRGERNITQLGYDNSSAQMLPAGTVLFSSRAPIGYVAIAKNELCTNQGFKSVIPKPGVCDSNFLYYLLTYYKNDIEAIASGTTFMEVSGTALKNFKVRITDIQTQERIAAILSSLDDKIEVNNQINRNLEEQAKAIFKSWFVDFEPFQNGEFVHSELGKIPKGWRIGHFSDLISSTVCGDWGKDSPTGNYTEEVYCIRGADIPEVNAGNKGKMPLRFILPKNLKPKRLSAGDIVVEISGGSPTQSTGRSALISDALLSRYKREMICTNFCRAITPKKGYSFWASVLWKKFYSSSVFFQYENGTTGIKNLDLNGFIENEPIIIPPKEVAIKFEELGNGFVSTIFGNGLESEHLSMIRDTLLTKLMSGEIPLS